MINRDYVHIVNADYGRQMLFNRDKITDSRQRENSMNIKWLLNHGYVPAKAFHAELERRPIADEEGNVWNSCDEYVQHLLDTL